MKQLRCNVPFPITLPVRNYFHTFFLFFKKNRIMVAQDHGELSAPTRVLGRSLRGSYIPGPGITASVVSHPVTIFLTTSPLGFSISSSGFSHP